ncbi:MAG: DUF6457 domain-containing protein [Actinomycetota bacterium]|jgi:hypothetical protein|nr:DUF6457 domain-containing protein [Actinomycetota bacterium]
MMDRADWIQAFAAALGVPDLPEHEVELVLAVAAEAAHASERSAAPLACWMAGRAGLGAEQALEVARRVLRDMPSAPGNGER